MLAQLLIAALLLQAATNPSATRPSTSPPVPASAKDPDIDSPDLLRVKRIYVDSFGDDMISRELQSMVVSSLAATKRFKVTENRDHADAILKGVALEKSNQELHAYSEGTVAGRGAIRDSSAHTETVNETKLSVRLVNPDGDVIWTSTEESKGAKYKGSSADVADKCVKRLLHDVERLEGPGTARAPAMSSTQQK
jgi:hypothetical protein